MKPGGQKGHIAIKSVVDCVKRVVLYPQISEAKPLEISNAALNAHSKLAIETVASPLLPSHLINNVASNARAVAVDLAPSVDAWPESSLQ